MLLGIVIGVVGTIVCEFLFLRLYNYLDMRSYELRRSDFKD